MKILIVQNKVYEQKAETFRNIKNLLKSIELKTIDFIVLPEMFSTPYEHKYFEMYKEDDSKEVFSFLSNLAKQSKSYVIGGSFPEKENENIYNTSLIFDRNGLLLTKYRKIHLFKVKYPNGKSFSEADILKPGENLSTFDTEFGKMGVMICFDIRFPEQADKLRELGAKIIFVPAAFNSFTGPLHWETTFKARAIDNQIFIVGASPSQDSFGDYQTYGHSIACNPYGKVLGQLSGNEGLLVVDFDLNEIEKARTEIPIINNKVKL